MSVCFLAIIRSICHWHGCAGVLAQRALPDVFGVQGSRLGGGRRRADEDGGSVGALEDGFEWRQVFNGRGVGREIDEVLEFLLVLDRPGRRGRHEMGEISCVGGGHAEYDEGSDVA